MVELLEKSALLTQRHKTTEESPVSDTVQAPPKIDHEFSAGGIFLERLFGIARHIGHDPLRPATAFTAGADQHWTNQLDTENAQ
ncbi:hypothetical protein D3C78_1457640 [compost metagenome]